MADDSLFPELAVPDAIPEKLSAGRRLTLRQKQAIERGVHPLTGQAARPDLGTCGGCVFRQAVGGHAKSYPKCSWGATGSVANNWPRATRGPATDVRAGWPACAQFQPKDGATSANNG